MKKLILTALAVTCSVSAFAQGTVFFGNRSGAGTTHVWGVSLNSANWTLSLIGAGTNDNPPGSIDYASYNMKMIGADGLTGLYGAATTFAQLLAAPGANRSEGSLVPASPTTTFRTGGAQGCIAFTTATLAGVPEDAPVATLMMVAWDNSSGKYPTWKEAYVAWVNGYTIAGKSGTFNVLSIGGVVNTPPSFYIPSFNLYHPCPEPSTFTLAGLGLAALLLFRRRK